MNPALHVIEHLACSDPYLCFCGEKPCVNDPGETKLLCSPCPAQEETPIFESSVHSLHDVTSEVRLAQSTQIKLDFIYQIQINFSLSSAIAFKLV